jgi:hypothetical protein
VVDGETCCTREIKVVGGTGAFVEGFGQEE